MDFIIISDLQIAHACILNKLYKKNIFNFFYSSNRLYNHAIKIVSLLKLYFKIALTKSSMFILLAPSHLLLFTLCSLSFCLFWYATLLCWNCVFLWVFFWFNIKSAFFLFLTMQMYLNKAYKYINTNPFFITCTYSLWLKIVNPNIQFFS